MNRKRSRLFNRRTSLIILVPILCFLGFQPGGRFRKNEVLWTGEEAGLVFSPGSMVYSRDLTGSGNGEEKNFLLEMEIKPVVTARPRFGVILQIYNRESVEELTIGQWGNSLMILDSNDYSNRRRLPKIYGDMGSVNTEKQIRIISESGGTSLYIDGVLSGENKNLHLTLPQPVEKNTVILGNSIHGYTPWTGELKRISLGTQWSFDFRIASRDAYPELVTPAKIKDLQPEILAMPRLRSLETGVMSVDIFFNFIGFIPLGYLVLLNLGSGGRKKLLSLSVLTCFLSFFFSLTIEISQVWIPGRNSSMLDLILNSLGGFAGAIAAHIKLKKNQYR